MTLDKARDSETWFLFSKLDMARFEEAWPDACCVPVLQALVWFHSLSDDTENVVGKHKIERC